VKQEPPIKILRFSSMGPKALKLFCFLNNMSKSNQTKSLGNFLFYMALVTNLELSNQDLEAENAKLSSRLSRCRCHEVRYSSQLFFD
jgi:hypothetical protein